MGKLRGHGFSEETIASILTDRFTFVRYLMPEAQSVLLCDKADFKAIMDFLFYAISVCTDRRLNDLLTKAFFDLRKNYGFKWTLKIGHVLAVLLNYGANRKVILRDKSYSFCLNQDAAYRYGVEKKLPSFFVKRRKRRNADDDIRGVVSDDQFEFCVARFVVLLSEFSAGLTSHLEMVVKDDFSDQCVFLFLVLLIGTDRRFVTNFRVIESITSLLHYNFESVPANLWYKGSVPKEREQRKEQHANKNFIRTLAKMVNEFMPGYDSPEVMNWRPDGKRDDEKADHPLNMLHKLELIPVSFRGNQLKKQLAFLYLQTRLQIIHLVDPEMATILDVVSTPQLRNCARETYLKVVTHKSSVDYVALLPILKLLDIIVGFEPELDFTEEKVEAIKIMEKELLEVLRKKLPSIGMSAVPYNINFAVNCKLLYITYSCVMFLHLHTYERRTV